MVVGRTDGRNDSDDLTYLSKGNLESEGVGRRPLGGTPGFLVERSLTPFNNALLREREDDVEGN